MTDGRQVVGKPEIAKLLKVERDTPAKWVYRKLLPEPDHPPVNGGPAWTVDVIREWAIRTKRWKGQS